VTISIYDISFRGHNIQYFYEMQRSLHIMELAFAILTWTSAASHKSQRNTCEIYTANMIFF